jgi:hypothetical protein
LLGEAREGGEVLLRSGMGRQGRSDPGRIGDGVDAEGGGGRGGERACATNYKAFSDPVRLRQSLTVRLRLVILGVPG